MAKIEVGIFDFDGVIADNETDRYRFLNILLAQHGLSLKDLGVTLRSTAGIRTADLINSFPPNFLSLEERRTILTTYQLEFKANILASTTPVEPTVDFLKIYKGSSRFAIASMSKRSEIEKILVNLGIRPRFDVIASREDISFNHPKPYPDIYQEAMRRMQISPDKCLAVEDTVVGSKAAIAAGIACYILLNGLNDRSDFSSIQHAGFIHTRQDFDNLFLP